MADDRNVYEVGYGKPPRHTRWPKGTSGNPKGRPRQKQGMRDRSFNPFLDVFLKEMDRVISVRERGEIKEVEAFAAVVRSLVAKAVGGDVRAQKAVVDLNRQAQSDHLTDLANQQKCVEQYKKEWPLRARLAKAADEPLPLPLPEHINFVLPRGIEISGPSDTQQLEAWSDLKEQLRMLQSVLDEAVDESESEPGSTSASRVERLTKLLNNLEREVPPGWNWREEG